MNPRRTIIQAALLFLFSLVAAVFHRNAMPTPGIHIVPRAVNTSTNRTITDSPTTDTLAGSDEIEIYPELGLEVIYVTLAEAVQLFESGEAQFVDAREPEEYDTERIPGAVSLPFEAFAYDVEPMMEQLLPEQLTVVYCDSGCESSKLVAGQLIMLGFFDTRIMEVGFATWIEAGYDTEKGVPADND